MAENVLKGKIPHSGSAFIPAPHPGPANNAKSDVISGNDLRSGGGKSNDKSKKGGKK